MAKKEKNDSVIGAFTPETPEPGVIANIPEEDNIEEVRYVFSKHPRCTNPRCNSHITKHTSTQGQIQYRKCLNCGTNFSIGGKKVVLDK